MIGPFSVFLFLLSQHFDKESFEAIKETWLEAGPFVPYDAPHLVVLIVLFASSAGLVAAREWLRVLNDQPWRRLLAVMLLGHELWAWTLGYMQGYVWLPLQLCDLTVLATAWALWSPRAWVAELAYFWALAGSAQAILTPDLQGGFPQYTWFAFFVSHGSVVLSVIYLAVTGRVRPTGRSIWRVWGITNLYAAGAGCVNWVYGTNYGYLAHKPMHPSLLDYFGPWPYYILVLEGMALVSFWVYYLPFVVARRRAAHGKSQTVE